MNRLIQLRRILELVRCFLYFDNPLRLSFIYYLRKTTGFPLNLNYARNGRSYTAKMYEWMDLATAWCLLLGNEYRIFSDDKVILDIGANVGLFAFYANSINPDSKIISVEPFPSTFDDLSENIRKSGLQGKVDLRRFALASVRGTVLFDSSPGIPSPCRGLARESAKNSIEVQSKRLVDLLEEESLATVDFMKIDIEGSEYDLIENTPISHLRRINRIAIEYHGLGSEAIQNKMKMAGFEISYHPKCGESGVVEFTQYSK